MKVNYRGMVSGLALLAGIGFPVVANAQSADPAAAPAAGPQAADQAAAGEPEEGEVIVTGIRRSLEDAAEIKRRASSIVDAISAEDMGAFPDQNIAESLQRVTGVQIQRDRGEGRDISIRGLDPKFSRIMLNGDGLVSISPLTGLNPNGLQALNRSFDFTLLSSDFVQTLIVSKSSTADQEEGGLAGTVDVQTLRPLSLKKDRLSVTVEGLRNAYADKWGPHIGAAFAGKFFNDTLGVAIGADYSKRFMFTESYQSSGQDTRQENQVKTNGQSNLFTNTGSVGTGFNTGYVDWNGDGDNLDAYRWNHLIWFEEGKGKRERQTYNLGLQWRPTDRVEVYFNGVHSYYNSRFVNANYTTQNHIGGDPNLTGNRVSAAHISTIPAFSGDVVTNGTAGRTTCTSVGVSPATGCTTQAVPPNPALPISGIVDYYMLRGGIADNVTKLHQSTSKTWQAQLGTIYHLSDKVRVDVQGSYLTAKRDSVLNAGMDAFSYKDTLFDARTDYSGIPTVGYGPGSDFLNPATYNSGTTFFSGFIVPQKIKQSMASGNLTWDDPLPWMTSFKVGYKHSQTVLDQTNFNISVPTSSFAALSGDTLVANTPANGVKAGGITLTNYMRTYGGSGFLSRYNGPSTFPRTWVGPDLEAVLAKYPISQLSDLKGAGTAPTSLSQTLATTYRIREMIDAMYFRADFTGFEDKLTGNIGLRMVHTKSYSSGYTGDPSDIFQANPSTLQYRNTSARFTVPRSYWSALPSLNMMYKVDDNKVLRFAASQTVTRPDFTSLLPSNGALNLTTQTTTIANPNLEPYYSINLDFGGEWYFGRESMFSATFFQKYIRGYNVNEASQLPITYTNSSGVKETRIFAASRPVNGSETTSKGVELALQTQFTFLPGPLSGFGTQLNYTYTDSGQITSSVGGQPFGLPFVSKHAANAVLYYEKYGFSARAAYVWRSKYMEAFGGVGGDSRGGSYVKSSGFLDLSSKYQITPNVAVTADLVNALNTPIERTTIYGIGRGYEVNGRTLTVGARLTF